MTDIRNVANCLNAEEVVVDPSLVIKSKSGGIPADNRKIFQEPTALFLPHMGTGKMPAAR
jgi:hypothetical protein